MANKIDAESILRFKSARFRAALEDVIDDMHGVADIDDKSALEKPV